MNIIKWRMRIIESNVQQMRECDRALDSLIGRMEWNSQDYHDAHARRMQLLGLNHNIHQRIVAEAAQYQRYLNL